MPDYHQVLLKIAPHNNLEVKYCSLIFLTCLWLPTQVLIEIQLILQSLKLPAAIGMDLVEEIVELKIIMGKKWEFTDSPVESKFMSMKSTKT